MKAIYLIAAIALMLVPIASASYTIDPETKGWAVMNVADESYTIKVKNTGDHTTVILDVTPRTFTYIENETVYRPVPEEMMRYITVTPQTIILSPNEEFIFTVHISFPDTPEIYGHTWEYRLLFNDTNKYNYQIDGLQTTQKTHIVRLFIPTTKPVIPMETPFYVYPFIIIFSLIFLGGMVIYLKKRSVPLAMKDHAVTGSEWAGMEVGSVPTMQPEVKKNSPLAVETKAQVPPEIMAFIEDPIKNDVPIREVPVIRKPVPIKPVQINGLRSPVPKRSHQKKVPMES